MSKKTTTSTSGTGVATVAAPVAGEAPLVQEIHESVAEQLEREEAARLKRIRYGEEPGYLPVSYSSLSDYERCPALYKFRRENSQVGDRTLADLGNEVHLYKKDGDQYEISGALPLLKQAEYEQLKQRMDRYVLDPGAELERVIHFEWEIKPGLKAHFKAILDVLTFVDDGVARIIDWKTGQKVDYDEHRLQRKLYALAAIREFPEVWKVETKTVYLMIGKEVPSSGWEEYDAGDLEEFAVTLEAKVRLLAEDTQFKPKPGPSCRLCDFAHKCPAAQDYLAPYELKFEGGKIVVPAEFASDPEFLLAAGRALFQLEKVVKDLKATLKQACSTGRLELPETGGAYANYIKTSKRIESVAAILPLLAEYEIPVDEVLSFNHTRGSKYLNKYPDLAELAVEVEDRYPSFEWRKTPKPEPEPSVALEDVEVVPLPLDPEAAA